MRNISFALTTEAFLNGSKDVTRRNGWTFLKVGDRLMAVEKGQGLKKGEKVRRLGEIVVLDARREPLSAIRTEPDGCKKEGFPKVKPRDFIRFYCQHNGGHADQMVTRIVFRKLKCPKCASPHVTVREFGSRLFYTCKICGKVWDEEAK